MMRACQFCGHVRESLNTCPECGRFDREVIESIQISPSATPTSRNSIPPRTPNNSFEKGNRLDERGIAYLDSSGHPLKMKETFDQRKYGGRGSVRVSTGGNS